MSGLGVAMGIFAGFLLGVRVGLALARREAATRRITVKRRDAARRE
ncbi:MAG: hypothetical protein JWP97_2432 [Labilithrix sp.]|nr:hypothetical protein [Labilithrix sp.]